MKKTTFKLTRFVAMTAAAFAMLIGVVRAQSQLPYDVRGPMQTYADVQTKNLWQGWSADCNTGRIPAGFVLVRTDPATNISTFVPIVVTTGPRPDAQAYLASIRCNGGAMDVNLGWGIQTVSPEPPGEFLYTIEVADMPYSQTCGYDVNNGLWCGYAVNTVYKTLRD